MFEGAVSCQDEDGEADAGEEEAAATFAADETETIVEEAAEVVAEAAEAVSEAAEAVAQVAQEVETAAEEVAKVAEAVEEAAQAVAEPSAVDAEETQSDVPLAAASALELLKKAEGKDDLASNDQEPLPTEVETPVEKVTPTVTEVLTSDGDTSVKAVAVSEETVTSEKDGKVSGTVDVAPATESPTPLEVVSVEESAAFAEVAPVAEVLPTPGEVAPVEDVPVPIEVSAVEAPTTIEEAPVPVEVAPVVEEAPAPIKITAVVEKTLIPAEVVPVVEETSKQADVEAVVEEAPVAIEVAPVIDEGPVLVEVVPVVEETLTRAEVSPVVEEASAPTEVAPVIQETPALIDSSKEYIVVVLEGTPKEEKRPKVLGVGPMIGRIIPAPEDDSTPASEMALELLPRSGAFVSASVRLTSRRSVL
ncbi:hypothetical protein CCH79_00016656 [Gambusia affinis]|uniref:Uncharacterized protein n=1 Tax=Gambusia affinis TaxID=33528 RepID=A0A315WBP4_GAMAF|nr:hypothetical protein CCH79_00016656 [Gambusia affinis]